MFNKSKPNIILISDHTDVISMSRTLGVHKVAYCLRQAGFEVAVIHHASVFTVDEIFHLLNETINESTLFVGVNNFFYSSVADPIIHEHGQVELKCIQQGSLLPHGREFNQQLKDLIRSRNQNCKLVLGGPTALDVAYNSIFDYIVVGYAELSIVKLAQFLNKQEVELPPKHKSVFGPVVINDSKAVGYDFSNSHMYYEDHDAILPRETLMLEIGRGCIFSCAFCSYPMNGKKKMDFIRSMNLIRDELIDNYNRFKVTNYLIVDDTFNDSVEKCRIFSDMVKTLPFKINWWAYIRLDLLAAHPETIDYLVESGARAMHFGIETFNPKTASTIGKGGDREKLLNAARKIKDKYKENINLHGNVIWGLPYESMESMKKTADYLLSDKNPLDSWRGYPLNIRPNDRTYAHGFLSDIDKNYEKYGYKNQGTKQSPGTLYTPTGHHDHGQMIWSNEYTDREEVEKFALDVDNRRKQQVPKISGQFVFFASSLGLDVETFLNKKESDIDWHQKDQLKLSRANEYKTKIFQQLGVSPKFTDITGIETYSELLRSKKLVQLSDFANK